VGFYGIYIFTASFDYSDRVFFVLFLVLSSVYAAVHIVRTRRSKSGGISQGRVVTLSLSVRIPQGRP